MEPMLQQSLALWLMRSNVFVSAFWSGL
jgi:hypothetical protein